MLSLSNFATHPKLNNTCISQNPISKSLLFNPKNVKFLNFDAVFRKNPSGFCLNASKNRKKGGNNVLEMEVSKVVEEEGDDDEEDFEFSDEEIDIHDDDDDVEYIDGEDDDDDEVIIPLRNMKKWMKNKPRGFGEGKVYDTPVEDKLMEEIEQSRKAQLVNVNILKHNPEKGIPKKEKDDKSKVAKDVYEGYRVRLVNLPKKKNVHRDLKLAFQGVSGMLNITPAVYGNKKTRDPVCKGLAFIDFKSEKEASRFVETYSGQSIAFGKVQKQITCELVNADLTKSAYKPPINAPRLVPLTVDEDTSSYISTIDSNSNEESVSYASEDASEEHLSAVSEDDSETSAETNVVDILEVEVDTITSENEEHLSAERENLEENLATSSVQESNITDVESAKSMDSLKQLKKSSENAKKGAPKRKKEKNPKLNIPGSANRLKIREKAMLTDVFSKYAGKTATATKEQS